jgi:hypothetical protein
MFFLPFLGMDLHFLVPQPFDRDGSRASAGRPSFQKILSAMQVRAIQAWIFSRAWAVGQTGGNAALKE